MKKYIKEIIICIMQLFMFYIFPFFGGPTDAMGVVVLIIFVTLLLSLVMGSFSELRIKFIYPIVVSLVFIPTIFIHYNASASIHALWYLVISLIGIATGSLIKLAAKKIKRK